MLNSFIEWWRRPLRTRDRVAGFVIGLFGGFWAALLGRLFLGPLPVSFTALAYWAAGGVIVGAILGLRFPRPVTLVLYPFAFIGFGSGS